MINQNFVYLSALLILVGDFHYLVDTFKGRVKPNRVSWFIWFLAPLIALLAQIQQGVGIQSVMTFALVLVPLLIFIATFVNKEAEWKLRRLDLICGSLSIVGLLLWYITKVGNIAILFSIFADGLAAVPTVVKSYQFPKTESYFVYLMSAIAAVVTLLTIKTWNFETYAFSLYIFAVCLILTILIKFRIGERFSKNRF